MATETRKEKWEIAGMDFKCEECGEVVLKGHHYLYAKVIYDKGYDWEDHDSWALCADCVNTPVVECRECQDTGMISLPADMDGAPRQYPCISCDNGRAIAQEWKDLGQL